MDGVSIRYLDPFSQSASDLTPRERLVGADGSSTSEHWRPLAIPLGPDEQLEATRPAAMGVEVKKGLRNPLDEAQVRKAVLALQAFVDKQKAERAKQPLVENADSLSCIITRKLVPGKASLKPISMCASLYCGLVGARSTD